ncbi:MAG: VWA domain-containing protein [Acidobacteriota bacterium]|nr:VWA domain-containing protein [Acidobacteriota bacterium]
MRTSAFAVALLVTAPLAMAQSAASGGQATGPDTTQGTITLKQNVSNVIIDVVVNDKHGHPVKALKEGQFQVFENGVPQDIAYFEEHGPGEAAAKPAPQQPELPADVYTNVTQVPANGPLMVLLLDALNTNPDQQSYVRAQVIDYLKHLPAGSQMAIFTLGDNLQLIQGFTSDPAVLRAALDGKAYPEVPTLTRGGLMAAAPDPMGHAAAQMAFSRNVGSVRASLNRFANESTSLGMEMRVNYTLDALNALTAYLADIPGRKSLIWFAGTVPWVINPDFSLVTTVTGRSDFDQALKDLANEMTTGRISVYPMDAQGMVVASGFGADDAGGMRGTAFANQMMDTQMNLAGEHMTMSNLANATGGRALYNTNGLSEAVAKVEAIGENYYTIAYSPKDKTYDGNLRQVQVKVSDPGVKLEYRRGYYADNPAGTAQRTAVMYTNPLRAAMQRGAPDATQIPFRVRVRQAMQQPDPAKPSGLLGNNAANLKGPLVRYDFHWNVDANSIQFTPAGNGMERGEVDATIYAYDADGRILNNVYAILPLNLTAAQYSELMKNGLPMKQSLDVPAGVVHLRAGLVDPSTGHTGSTEFQLDVRP